jgi:hypothetical protein
MYYLSNEKKIKKKLCVGPLGAPHDPSGQCRTRCPRADPYGPNRTDSVSEMGRPAGDALIGNETLPKIESTVHHLKATCTRNHDLYVHARGSWNLARGKAQPALVVPCILNIQIKYLPVIRLGQIPSENTTCAFLPPSAARLCPVFRGSPP